MRSQPKKLQFSLRSLFVLVAVVAVGLSLARSLNLPLLGILPLLIGIAYVCIGLWRASLPIAAVGGAFILVFLALLPWSQTNALQVQLQSIGVTFHVRDATGAPIRNATLRLSDFNGTNSAMTDADGTAIVGHTFQTSERVALFPRIGSIELHAATLSVTAAGFLDFERDLSEVVGKKSWDLYAPNPPSVLITLDRKETHETTTTAR